MAAVKRVAPSASVTHPNHVAEQPYVAGSDRLGGSGWQVSMAIMEANGVTVDTIRAIDHDIATGVWPDMAEHGWPSDSWPAPFERVSAGDSLVLRTAVRLGW